MKGVFLLLGSNLENKTENLQKAIDLLQNNEVAIVDYSSVYRSEPWGNEKQDWFLNLVLRIDTGLSPIELLEHNQLIEKKMGRVRLEKWGARIIDIDILYYDNFESKDEKLILPHPGIPSRRFTLIPLNEMIPNEIHPTFNTSQKELLDSCTDPLKCEKTGIILEV